ncbi:MAG: TIGR04219 family outer membrane beta-barrel protein [Nitrospirota bacterium]
MRTLAAVTAVLLVFLAVPAYALMGVGLEVAVGGAYQDPSGYVASQSTVVSDRVDVESDAGYDSEFQVYGRAKLELPLILPNVYVMATPMKFDGTGSKNVSFDFKGRTFNASVPFQSEVTLNHYDVALYYDIPFLDTLSMGKLGAELGLNVRFLDLKAEVDQPTTGTSASAETSLVVPMVYAGVQVNPVDLFSLEGELRAIAYDGDSYWDLIGRVKVKPMGPLFVAGGYRYESVDIEQSNIEADLEFSGPFIEAGVAF